MKSDFHVVRKTAREILVSVAGKDHELHSIAKRYRPKEGVIPIECSCGKRFEVRDTKDNERALDSAPKAARS